MLVYIIIPVHNNIVDTLACLDSLNKQSGQTKIVLIDNASTDKTATAVGKRFLDVQIIKNETNQSYAASANQGAEYAFEQGADAVLILNNDTVCNGYLVDQLTYALQKNPSIGIISPTIYYASSPDLVWFAGGVCKPHFGLTYHQGIRKRTPQVRAIQICDYVSGCAMMIRRECFDSIGGFDEGYSFYSEDADFCLRAREKGWLSAWTPRAAINHKVSATVNSKLKLKLKLKGNLRLLIKHNSLLMLPIALCGFVLFTALQAARKILKK